MNGYGRLLLGKFFLFLLGRVTDKPAMKNLPNLGKQGTTKKQNTQTKTQRQKASRKKGSTKEEVKKRAMN